MLKNIISFFLVFLLFSQPAAAFEKLFAKHCKAAKVPKEVAMAIARQESAMNPLCVNVAGETFKPESRKEAEDIIRKAAAADQSYDVGLMQINSQWIKLWKIDPVSLLDPETNIQRGVSILRDEILRHGMNWRAIGAYHSPNPARAVDYADKVIGHINGKTNLKNLNVNPRLAILLEKGIITKAELKSILANPRLQTPLARKRLNRLRTLQYGSKTVDRPLIVVEPTQKKRTKRH